MSRILHIITSLQLGGAETMLARLLEHRTSRFEHRVLAIGSTGPLQDRIGKANVEVTALGLPRPNLSRILETASSSFHDVDLIQTWLYHADLFGLAVAAALQKPIAWNLRCSDMDLSAYRWTTRLVVHLLAASSKMPSAILYNSAAGRSHHAQLGYRPKQWLYVPNGIDLHLFRPDPVARAAVRDELGCADRPLVGMIARVDPAKGHSTLLAAVNELPSDVELVLAGRGTAPPGEALVAMLGALGGRKVHLLGQRLDPHRVANALDVLVMGSDFGEGFPNALLEGMACGISCVTTDVGDAASVLAGHGWVVPRKQPHLLALAMAEALDESPGQRAERSRLLTTRAAEFSIERVVQIYEEAWTELLQDGQTRCAVS